MARCDYCQYVLLEQSCYDYTHDNCDGCNVYKAYLKGAEDGARKTILILKGKEQEHE